MAEVRSKQRKGDTLGKEATAPKAAVAAPKARLTSKGQITIPKEVRERLGIRPGDSLEFHFDGDRLEVRPLRRRSISEFRGMFKVDNPPQIPWEEQRRIAWDAMTRRLVYPRPPEDE